MQESKRIPKVTGTVAKEHRKKAQRRSVWAALPVKQAGLVIVLPLLLYILFITSLTFEPIQRSGRHSCAEIHITARALSIKSSYDSIISTISLKPKYDTPEAYGFASNRVRNFYIHTSDGIRLGVWHVLPQAISNQFPPAENLTEAIFDGALRADQHPTMLYFHGNAGSRLAGHRIQLARHISSLDMNMNFVAIDYRGFADSSNTSPSQAGLYVDAQAIWDWLTITKDVPAEQIVLAGQSLGTAVAAGLAAQLAHNDISPRALVLTAPFTSIRDLLLTYNLFGFIPILQPLNPFPRIRDFMLSFLRTHFDTQSIIRKVSCPILLIHSLNDGNIVSSHSDKLFHHLLSEEAWSEHTTHIMTERLGRFGILKSFFRSAMATRAQKNGRPLVAHLETHFGGHNQVTYGETTLRVIKNIVADGWQADAI